MRTILGFVVGLGAGAFLFGMQARRLSAGNGGGLPMRVGEGVRDFGGIAFRGLAMGTGIVLAGKLVECLMSEAKKR